MESRCEALRMDILDYYTEQKTVCGSKLKTSGIIVLFKWKQIQRILRVSSTFLPWAERRNLHPHLVLIQNSPELYNISWPQMFIFVWGAGASKSKLTSHGNVVQTPPFREKQFLPPGSLWVTCLQAHTPAGPWGKTWEYISDLLPHFSVR